MTHFYQKFENHAQGSQGQFNEICPFCASRSTFHSIGQDHQFGQNDERTGIGFRYCANEKCKAVLTVIFKKGKVMRTYPGLSMGINVANVPASVADAFKEAEACMANNCFVAAAIMIRKTLEELCNERGAMGKNLFQRVEEIIQKTLLPKALAEAMHELRLLGNDAAHIESKSFETIGNDELRLSMEFTQEIVKGIYQYDALLERLRSLKKNAPA